MGPLDTWVREGQFRRFGIVVLLVVSAAVVVSFLLLGAQITRSLETASVNRARDYAELIVAARKWNSEYGGVWVVKGPGVETNPYLAQLGVKADTATIEGTALTMRNPAIMTEEIGAVLSADSEEYVRLTSLLPVNPNNRADAWEQRVLQSMEQDRTDHSTVEGTGEMQRLRYMRPLVVEESCLKCHDTQGYKVGDVRGAISISLEYEETARAIRGSRISLAVLCVGVLGMVSTIILVQVRGLEREVHEATNSLRVRAVTDGLTGLNNRQTILQRLAMEIRRAVRRKTGVGVLMVDLDHFKRVNDTHGHPVGDVVLRRVAETIQHSVRDYDSVGRVGGEEFLVVAPDIDERLLASMAERIRTQIEAIDFDDVIEGLRMTASVGTTLCERAMPESPDSVIARADAALYRAKAEGRNRVAAG